MANYIVTDTELTSIADAIRTKGGTSASLTFPTGFVTAIGNISGGGSYSWMGKNPYQLYYNTDEAIAFEDTPWNTWTPTTTSTKLSDPSTHFSLSVNLADYDYIIHFQMYEELYYSASATAKARLEKACIDQWAIATRYASNRTNLTAKTRNGNNAVSVLAQSVMDYYNTSGSRTIAYSWGYGLFPSNPTPTFASSTATSTTLYVKVPQYNARCSTTYLTTANAGYVNKSTSFYTTSFEVHRVDAGTSLLRACQDNRMTLFNSGL